MGTLAGGVDTRCDGLRILLSWKVVEGSAG